MRILVADDHKLIREIVSSHLEKNGDFEVSQCENVEEVLQQIDQTGKFDVILLDVAMPGMHGLQGLHDVVEANAPGSTVLFSGTARRETVNDAINMGARGFIPKTLPARSLTNAIQFIASGEIFLPAAFHQDRIDNAGDNATPIQHLNPMERSILRSLCTGNTNKEIAREQDLTEVTVKMHLRAICNKLGAKNRTHAAMLAREAGIA